MPAIFALATTALFPALFVIPETRAPLARVWPYLPVTTATLCGNIFSLSRWPLCPSPLQGELAGGRAVSTFLPITSAFPKPPAKSWATAKKATPSPPRHTFSSQTPNSPRPPSVRSGAVLPFTAGA
ncbi:hypothetical protein HMPREF0262_01682 [Clostridium sp. ATCC 29733]|nr:hypothetical protein HMPREF0262_01682 [Clostridium sp. ATCC 29733]